MKIKIESNDKTTLNDLKQLIDEALKINSEEWELSEENLQKAKRIKDKINQIIMLQFRYKGIDIKIVNSDGAELTKII